jgi:hypothetical protein
MVSKNSMGDELASRRHAKLPNWQDINFWHRAASRRKIQR